MTEPKNKSSLNISGLTPVRTARVISALIAAVGMVLLLIQRVLSAVIAMAGEALTMGLSRYNSFSGRMALQNFPEDRQLFKMLKDAETLLPIGDHLLLALLIVSIVVLVIALFGLAFPRHFVHILVAIKMLRWANYSSLKAEKDDDSKLRDSLAKLGEMPLKKLALPVGVIVALILSGVAVSSCREKIKQSSTEGMVDELQQQTLAYITAQKSFFSKSKLVGGPKSLQLPDSSATDAFSYKVTASRFVAVSRVPIGKCPAGSKWSVTASTKGVFNKELSLYRATPKDSSCATLTPDYKKIGRN